MQQPVFIGTVELFRQVDQNEWLLLLSGRIPAWQRGEIDHVVKPSEDLDLSPRLRMPAVDPVEACDIDPLLPEQNLQGAPFFEGAGTPRQSVDHFG